MYINNLLKTIITEEKSNDTYMENMHKNNNGRVLPCLFY